MGAFAVLGTALALALALQTQPQVPAAPEPPGAQLALQARQLWAQLRPGAAPAGALRHTRLGEREINALLAQAGPAARGAWRAQVQISQGRLHLRASHPAPRRLGWLNLELVWAVDGPVTGAPPPLVQARLGRLPLPPAGVTWLARRWLAQQPWRGTVESLWPMLDGWQATPGQLWLHWRWQPERASQALAGLLSEPEKTALLAQHQVLNEELRRVPAGQAMALPALLQPMARLAVKRLPQSDAATELRALLTTATLHALGRDLGAWLPQRGGFGPVPPVLLSLREREDMAQHFLLSALLAWQGGQKMAAALGLAKELADTRGGSGFSFTDLAADGAGARFGALCAADAQGLLHRLAAGLPEADFFPEVADLPEYLSVRDFRRQFGPMGGPAYEAQMQRIGQRVAALPLYKGLSGR